MTDRFELEQSILRCWNITDDVDALYASVMNTEDEIDKDSIANYLLGLKTIYDVKFTRLFEQFEQLKTLDK